MPVRAADKSESMSAEWLAKNRCGSRNSITKTGPLTVQASVTRCNLSIMLRKFSSPFPYPFQVHTKELHPQYPQHEKPMRVVTACLKSYLQLIATIPDFTDNLLGFSGGQGVAGSNPVIPIYIS